MARLDYISIVSLDGYVADAEGNFDWGAPDAEVHGFINALQRDYGTLLYGRRMYEVMVFWETEGDGPDASEVEEEYARIWRSQDKVVYSRTLSEVSSAATRLEREFDPDSVRQMKAEAGKPLAVGGAELAGQALREGLVDQVHLFVSPVTVGGGKRCLPADLRLRLQLLDTRPFDSGVVYLRYRVA
ncbi:dihydrofolate reductase family protein [Arthrobacter ginkgonis]|uniref:Dihydrofolate reductase family protein n=1 Tax=Arthrobacter ginkgonis TaxID=1630594 RepID=A0ABP7D9M7_9MICC